LGSNIPAEKITQFYKENTMSVPLEVFHKIYNDCCSTDYQFLLYDIIGHSFHKNLRELDYIVEMPNK